VCRSVTCADAARVVPVVPLGLNRVQRVDLEVNMIDRDSQQQTAHGTDCRSPSWRRRWPRVMLVALAGPLARRLFRLHVEGDQHLPASGPATDVAGHASPRQRAPRHHNANTSGTLPAPPLGETIDIDERVVVSPAAGVFTPLTAEGTHVQVGQRIGHVCTTSALIAVCTPFSGPLVTMTAVAGERVDRCQRVAWLRTRI
jgi:biotin carboxyl carrier protein